MRKTILATAVAVFALAQGAIAASPPPPAPRPSPPPAPAPRPAPAPAPRPAPAPSSSAKPTITPKPASSAPSSSKPTAAKPSTGVKQQPVPAQRLVPPTLPPRIASSPIGRGHNFTRDRIVVLNNPRYLDPYNPGYYGSPASPYYYMYLASLTDDDRRNDPLPPQYRQKRDGISPWWLLLVLPAAGLGFAAGRLS